MPSPDLNLYELMDQRSYSETATSHSYTRVYRVICSERVSEVAVRTFVKTTASTPTPAPFSINEDHPEDTTTKLKSIEAQNEAEDGRTWLVTVVWETPTGGGSLPTNPLDRPAEIEWATESEQEEIARDFSGTPKFIRNSAGDPFTNNPTRERGYLACTYKVNMSDSDFKSIVLPLMAYDYIVNSGTFVVDGQTIPALYARLEIPSAARTIEGAIVYYPVTFKLKFRKGRPSYETDGWRERYLDTGFMEVVGGEKSPIRDVDGQIVEKPYPLNGSGAAAASPTADPAILGPFKLYPEASFGSLPFA